MKNIFVVLGKGRSGTSALTKGLPIIDLDIGTALKPADSDNPRGFFEDTSVLSLNRIISHELNDPRLNIKSLPYVDKLVTPVFNKYKGYIKKIINSRFSNLTSWAFKDPRMMMLLPLWQEVFKEMQVNDHYIIMVRHPLASAKSAELFGGSEVEIHLVLWTYNYIAAIHATVDKPRVVILYDQLLDDPAKVYQRMITNLNLQKSVNPHLLDEYIKSFLDKKLNHHATYTDFDPSALCIRLYAILTELAEDKLQFGSSEFEEKWQSIVTEFERVKPFYQYMHQLYSENKLLHRKMELTQKSLLWRLTNPFHRLNEVLRARKNTKRKLQKLEQGC